MQDLNAMELELKSHSDFICKKMEELTAKHIESDASEELVTVLFQGNDLLKQCRDHLMMTMKTNFRADQERLRERKAVLADARALELSMAEFEEKFLKYNIPRRGDSMPFEEYEKRLRNFMEIWKKEAEKGRRKGDRSLMERLQELGEERAFTFEEVKAVAIDLGIHISRLLDEYFWFLAAWSEMETVMRILMEVETALKCLTVEGRSIFVDGFLAVVNLTKFAMSLGSVRKCYKKMEKLDRRHLESEEKDILRLILREVLRLEVAFRCPDLPMMLTDEVLLSMGYHLRKVFERTLSRVDLKMEELLKQHRRDMEDRDEEILNHVGEILDLRINGIWKKLVLHPGAKSC